MQIADRGARGESHILDRREQNLKLIDLVSNHEPIWPNELCKLVVPSILRRSAFYRRIDLLVSHRILDKTDDGRLVTGGYSALQEEIEAEIWKSREIHKEEAGIDKIALRVGRPPEDGEFRKAFYRVARKVRWNRTPSIIREVYPPAGQKPDTARTALREHGEDSPFFAMGLPKDAILMSRVSSDLLKTSISPQEMKKEWKEWAIELIAQEASQNVLKPSNEGKAGRRETNRKKSESSPSNPPS